MKPLFLLSLAIPLLSGAAFAQNTKGTGAEGKTTTTTNPLPPVVSTDSVDSRHRATIPSGTNRPNMAATEAAQPKTGQGSGSAPSASGSR